MAIRGLTLSSTFEYQSDADPDKGTPNATVFVLGPLDVFVSTHLFDGAMEVGPDQQVQFRSNAANLDAVRFGLKGWRNFKNEDGSDIPFETTERNLLGRKYVGVFDDCLARISIDEVRVMATQIREASLVQEAEAKNSAGV